MTDAFSVARLTFASITPGTFFNPFSIRMAQEAQVIPSRSSTVRHSGNWLDLSLRRFSIFF